MPAINWHVHPFCSFFVFGRKLELQVCIRGSYVFPTPVSRPTFVRVSLPKALPIASAATSLEKCILFGSQATCEESLARGMNYKHIKGGLPTKGDMFKGYGYGFCGGPQQ